MRIAFVSYEYPPETGGGGIGTYLECVAPALAEAGHEVTVFCGGSATRQVRQGGLTLQQIGGGSEQFGNAVCAEFAAHHQTKPFDLVEVTDFAAWGLEIQRSFPQVPYVVKLHTPSFVIDELHWRRPSILQRLRMGLGALRKSRPWPRFKFKHGGGHLRELETIRRASAIAATTNAVLQRIAQDVPEVLFKARVYPYPFLPSRTLLAAEADGLGDMVTYVGRLEPRKGVLDLAAAIPELCRQHADIRFRFVGRDMLAESAGLLCSQEILRLAGEFRQRVDILPAQPREEVLRLMAGSRICVFPSHWESFGIVVLEAMSAGRPVVVTKGSGMEELLDDDKTGLAVEPMNPSALCEAVGAFWKDQSLRRKLGAAARETVLHSFSVSYVLRKQIDHYEELVEMRRLGNRF